jgi:hypothetical protein
MRKTRSLKRAGFFNVLQQFPGVSGNSMSHGSA